MTRYLKFIGLLLFPLFAAGQPETIIEFKHTQHDFGLVKEHGGRVEHVFLFYNKGEKPLHIINVSPSCGCTATGWTEEAVEPGGMGFIKAEFDPFNRPGSFKKTLQVYSNAEPNPVTLTISGYVKPRPRSPEHEFPTAIGGLRVKYAALHMGNIKNNVLARKEFEVYNASDQVVKFLGDVVKPDHITIRFKPEKLQPGEVGLIDVSYDAPKLNDLGFRADNIIIKTNESGENSDKPLRVVAMIEDYFPPMTTEKFSKAPRIFLQETSQNFGVVNQGDTASVQFVLSNIGQDPLEIRQIKTSCDCVYVEQDKTVAHAGDSVLLNVFFDSAGRRGDQVKSATIFSNDPREPIKTIAIKGKVN